VAIIAFWLVMLGLFLSGEVWPRLAPTEPLMFPIDVVDEAGPQGDDTLFAVVRGDPGEYKTETDWPYRADLEWSYRKDDDTFGSKCTLILPENGTTTLVNSYRLTRSGEMKEIDAFTEYVPAQLQSITKIKAELKGSPRDGQFVPHIERTFPNDKDQAGSNPFTGLESAHTGEPIAVPRRGTVLNPLHPPRRFSDISIGQHWSLTVIDPAPLLKLVRPLEASGGDPVTEAEVAASARAYILEARVESGDEKVSWEPEKVVHCQIIRCTGDGPVGPLSFWVRQRDGSQTQPGYRAGDVMRLEVTLAGEKWTFARLGPGHKMRSFKQSLQKTP
jgi:hypothetical protein